MFDTLEPDAALERTVALPAGPGLPSVPLERLGARICELAGHLAAATCRFLVLLGDFRPRLRPLRAWPTRS
jgi:hypothetical protein